MIHREIQGTRVPALGFGTFRLAGEACREGVEHALALGYRHIDTAQGYGNEEEVGRGLAASGVPRDEVFLVTKVMPSNFRRDDAIRSARESLRKLGVDHVDLLLLHWPVPDVPVEETLDALHELQAEGAVRHLGVSNFPPSLTRRANAAQRIFANQVEYHPYLHQRPLRALAAELDLLLTAYSPVAKGAVLDDPVLRQIGEAHGKTAVQIALRWLLQQDHVAAIPKAASAEHREANLDVFDVELSDEEMERIHGLEREHRIVDPADGPTWERA
jgi:diketogulonate reductase-like aldo/keto reductase